MSTFGVSISQSECEEMERVVASATEEGFTFKEVTLSDGILAISHFSSQAVGEDGVPECGNQSNSYHWSNSH